MREVEIKREQRREEMLDRIPTQVKDQTATSSLENIDVLCFELEDS